MKAIRSMSVYGKIGAAGLLMLSSAGAWGDMYFEDKVTSDGGPQGGIGTMDTQRRVWISGDKCRVMKRMTRESSDAMAAGQKKVMQDKAQSGQLNPMAWTEEDEIRLNAARQAFKSTKGMGPKAEEQARKQVVDLEKKKALANSQAGREQREIADEKIGKGMGRIDENAVGKEVQKESAEVEIVRLDKGVIWNIQTRELVYSQKSIADEKKKRQSAGPQPAMAGGPKIDVKCDETGEKAELAGQECVKFQVSAVMNAGGMSIPYLSGEYWVAKDVGDKGAEYKNFTGKYGQDVAGGEMKALNTTLFMYNSSLMKPMRDKADALPGLVVKMTLKMTAMGATPGMPPQGAVGAPPPSAMAAANQGYTWEITKLSFDPIEPAQFELPPGLKKQN